MMNNEKIYTVAMASNDKINIINAMNGTVVHSFMLQGTLAVSYTHLRAH